MDTERRNVVECRDVWRYGGRRWRSELRGDPAYLHWWRWRRRAHLVHRFLLGPKRLLCSFQLGWGLPSRGASLSLFLRSVLGTRRDTVGRFVLTGPGQGPYVHECVAVRLRIGSAEYSCRSRRDVVRNRRWRRRGGRSRREEFNAYTSRLGYPRSFERFVAPQREALCEQRYEQITPCCRSHPLYSPLMGNHSGGDGASESLAEVSWLVWVWVRTAASRHWAWRWR